jgi:hypothetical protein
MKRWFVAGTCCVLASGVPQLLRSTPSGKVMSIDARASLEDVSGRIVHRSHTTKESDHTEEQWGLSDLFGKTNGEEGRFPSGERTASTGTCPDNHKVRWKTAKHDTVEWKDAIDTADRWASVDGVWQGLTRQTYQGDENDILGMMREVIFRETQDFSDNKDCVISDGFSDDAETAQWAGCPAGYFIYGLHDATADWLTDIKKVVCCRDKRWEKVHWGCIEADWAGRLRFPGGEVSATCPDDSFGITHLHRTSYTLGSLDKAMCCRMPCSMQPYAQARP